MDYDREITELKRRVDLAETKIKQQFGQFEFITGQLRDVQLYLHARFDEMDKRFDTLETEVKAIPRAVAEMLAKR